MSCSKYVLQLPSATSKLHHASSKVWVESPRLLQGKFTKVTSAVQLRYHLRGQCVRHTHFQDDLGGINFKFYLGATNRS